MYFIKDHAIRKYKRIVGRRSASKKKIISLILRDLKNDVKISKRHKIKNQYVLITSKYQAVISRKEVVTLLLLEDDPRCIEYKRKRNELLSNV